MTKRKLFPADPGSVPAARRFATATLRDIPRDVLETIQLMVSELATNGVQHARTSFELAIHRTETEIRIEVTDQGAGTPTMRSPAPEEPTGRGLRIVELLAERWGVNELPGAGKTVWFTLSAQPAAARAAGRP